MENIPDAASWAEKNGSQIFAEIMWLENIPAPWPPISLPRFNDQGVFIVAEPA
ncbi:hypothetical protein [Caldibacillus debilis]|uniref:hypothetical protein n=1 Tax=Caldibacillus debilis TaxID=301148 RepID=UPI001366615D|nr:hypothetical protein [Caldibacillus debilis]